MAATHQIRRILEENRTIAMVGLSARWHRPSYFAAKYLLDHGYAVIPVNPNHDSVLDQACYPDLESIPCRVDLVDLFQRAESTPDYARRAVAIGARAVWLQLGITHEETRRICAGASLDYVENRCMKIEHSRIFGGLNFIGVNTGIISSARLKTIAN